MLGIMQEQASRMAGLINDLLAPSGVELRRVSLPPAASSESFASNGSC